MHRRDVLKGVTLGAGGVLLSPLLSKLQAFASGTAATPKRFVFVVESNGARPEQLAPSGVRRNPRPQQAMNGPAELVDMPLADRSLPFSLEPIARYKNRVYTSAVETDRLDAMFDIGAASLICGLTNVLTLSSAAGIRDFDIMFAGLGLNIGKHGIGHGGSYQGKTWAELYDMIRRYHFTLIAGLMQKLERVREGDGTMLDNTVIVYLSDGAEAHHSRCWEWPMVVIGNLGGRLRAGRYLDYPGYGQRNHRTTANMYLTLLHAAGDNRETFGVADPALRDINQRGPLTELLA